MRTMVLVIVIFMAPFYMMGQKIIESHRVFPDNQKKQNKTSADVFHHYFSINPLNICLFQQIGITYEYRPGKVGFGITPGYIYPNKKEYSNWFIAGPINYGSLGWYSGWFVVPQVNLYLTKQEDLDEGGVVYLAAKFVFKHMQIDTTSVTVWKNQGDNIALYRKMSDNFNMYGAFIDVGYKYFLGHFFFDLNFGLGSIWSDHNMNIYAQGYGDSPNCISYLTLPVGEEYYHWTFTINFTLNLGGAF